MYALAQEAGRAVARALVAAAALAVVAAPAFASDYLGIHLRGTRLAGSCELGDSLACELGGTWSHFRSTTGALCPVDDRELEFSAPAIDAACFHPVHGLRVAGAIRNALSGTEEICGASWTDQDAPTCTAGAKDSRHQGADTIADKVEDTSATVASSRYQAVAFSTVGTYRCSFDLCADTAHDATIRVLSSSSGSTVSVNSCTVAVPACGAAAPFAFKRRDCALSATGTFDAIRCDIFPVPLADVANTGHVYVADAQLQPPTTDQIRAAALNPYCPSTGTGGTTCAKEWASIPAAGLLADAAGSVHLDLTPFWAWNLSATIDRIVPVAWGFPLLYKFTNDANLYSWDGSALGYAPTGGALVSKRLSLEWSGTVRRIVEDYEQARGAAVGAYDGGYTLPPATEIRLGNGDGAADHGSAYVKNVQFFAGPTRRNFPHDSVVECTLDDATCETGETVTSTRTTVGPLCASSGSDTSGLTQPAINAPCFHPTQGLRALGDTKNSLAKSESLCDTSAWTVPFGATSCTADNFDSPFDGTDTLADTICDQDTAVLRFEQAVTATTAGTWRLAIFACRPTGDGGGKFALGVDAVGGGGGGATTEYDAPDCAQGFGWFDRAAALTAGFSSVQASIHPARGAGNDPNAQGCLRVWGAHLGGPESGEKGYFRVPYCRSLGTGSTTCARDTHSISATGNYRNGGGVWLADLTLFWPMTLNPSPDIRVLSAGIGSGSTILYRNTDDGGLLRSFDGSNGGSSASASGTFAAGVTFPVRVEWRNNRQRVSVGGTIGASTGYGGDWPETAPTLLYIGSDNCCWNAWGYVKRLQIRNDASPIP